MGILLEMYDTAIFIFNTFLFTGFHFLLNFCSGIMLSIRFV
uniref:Uncharacterized protein n=1 Tax=Rhizophora mucronata TaxID=61149 RepID=A0A2P2NCR8_RHIMU